MRMEAPVRYIFDIDHARVYLHAYGGTKNIIGKLE